MRVTNDVRKLLAWLEGARWIAPELSALEHCMLKSWPELQIRITQLSRDSRFDQRIDVSLGVQGGYGDVDGAIEASASVKVWWAR